MYYQITENSQKKLEHMKKLQTFYNFSSDNIVHCYQIKSFREVKKCFHIFNNLLDF